MRRPRPGRDQCHRNRCAEAPMMHVDDLGQRRACTPARRRRDTNDPVNMHSLEDVPVPGLPNADGQIAIPLLIRDD